MDLPPNEVQYEETNTSDDDTATIVTAVATCFFVAFIAVTLRLVSRRVKHQYLQKHDYMAIIALAFAAGLSATVGVDLYAGLGKHTILSTHTTTFAKSTIATQILYSTSLIPLKLSLIFYYHRLSTSPRLNFSLGLLGIWVVAMGIAGSLMVIFNCVETPTMKVGDHCVDNKAAILFHGDQDVLTNLVLLCWSLPFIWGLKMDRVRVAHLMGVFSLGGFACAASVIRLIYLSNASLADPTWSSTAPTIWSAVELTIGLSAGSLATITPLITFILPSYSYSTSRRAASFISDAETAVVPSTTAPAGRKGHTRKVSFKDPPNAKRKSTKTGADSPGFTWRCSGRPSDLEKWKALPPPPPPPPPQLEALEEAHIPVQNVSEVREKDVEAFFGPEPMFRAVHYGGSI